MRLQHLCLWFFGCGLGGLSLAACQQGGAFDPLETAATQDLGQGKGQDLLPAVVDCKDAAAATATRCRVGDLRFTESGCGIMEPTVRWKDNTSTPAQIQLGDNNGAVVNDTSCGSTFHERSCAVQLNSSIRIGTAKAAHLKFTQEHYFNSNPNAGAYGLTRGILMVNGMRVYETAPNLTSAYSVDLPLPSNVLSDVPLSLTLTNEHKCLNYTGALGMYWKISDMTLEIER